MRRRTKIIIGIVVLVIAGVLTAGFASRRGKDVTPVTYGKVHAAGSDQQGLRERADRRQAQGRSLRERHGAGRQPRRARGRRRQEGRLPPADRSEAARRHRAQAPTPRCRRVFSDRDAAHAMAVAAEQDYQRAQKNFEQKIIPAAELDRAQSRRDSARANVVGARAAHQPGAREPQRRARHAAKTTMRAPMAGIVTALPVEEGEVAVIGTMNNAGTKLMTIADMSVVEAVMEVDETDVPTVKVGQRATVTIDAYPNKTFPGSSPRSARARSSATASAPAHRGGELRGQDPDRESAARRAAGILRLRRHHHRHAPEGAGHPDPGAGRPREAGQHAPASRRTRKASSSSTTAR